VFAGSWLVSIVHGIFAYKRSPHYLALMRTDMVPIAVSNWNTMECSCPCSQVGALLPMYSRFLDLQHLHLRNRVRPPVRGPARSSLAARLLLGRLVSKVGKHNQSRFSNSPGQQRPAPHLHGVGNVFVSLPALVSSAFMSSAPTRRGPVQRPFHSECCK
jgi:hypothetical protein